MHKSNNNNNKNQYDYLFYLRIVKVDKKIENILNRIVKVDSKNREWDVDALKK